MASKWRGTLVMPQGVGRVESASGGGLLLEAIALRESLLSDRLGSRVSHLTGGDEVYNKSFGSLIITLRQREMVEDFIPIIDRIDTWREYRNEALHNIMVKFQSGERPSWEDKVGPLPRIVQAGKEVLRAFDAIDRGERRKNGARPAATEPAAFGDDRAERLTQNPAKVAAEESESDFWSPCLARGHRKARDYSWPPAWRSKSATSRWFPSFARAMGVLPYRSLALTSALWASSNSTRPCFPFAPQRAENAAAIVLSRLLKNPFLT